MSLDREILAARGPKAAVDPWRPSAQLVEDECGPSGQAEPVATIFLTNRECPFRCLMCDLWQNTLDVRVPLGAIPAQIDFALGQLPPAAHLKLYNSGNFFDHQAIPPEDYPAIAARARRFRTVIVESHPHLVGDDCWRFRDLLGPEVDLEVAMGLETIHPEVWPRLNKRMTPDDFAYAADRLRAAGIHVRAFVLLRPPFIGEAEGIEWAVRSAEFARQAGARCVAVIPTRGGNGIMEQLAESGEFEPPTLSAVETVLERLLRPGQMDRVFVDLWDAERLQACPACAQSRIARLSAMNLRQLPIPPVVCLQPIHEILERHES